MPSLDLFTFLMFFKSCVILYYTGLLSCILGCNNNYVGPLSCILGCNNNYVGPLSCILGCNNNYAGPLSCILGCNYALVQLCCLGNRFIFPSMGGNLTHCAVPPFETGMYSCPNSEK